MMGFSGRRTRSIGYLDWGLMFFLPVQRRQLRHLLVGRCGQPFQHLFEIRVGTKAVHPAVLDQGVHHRAALARFFLSEKQPVLLADSCRSNGVLAKVVVDLHFAMFQEPFQHGPLVQGVANGFAPLDFWAGNGSAIGSVRGGIAFTF